MSQAGMDQLGKGFFPSPLNKWQLLAGQSMGWDVILFSLGQFKGKWEQTIAPKMTWKISSATPEGQQDKGMAERKGRNCGFFFFFLLPWFSFSLSSFIWRRGVCEYSGHSWQCGFCILNSEWALSACTHEICSTVMNFNSLTA